MDAGICQVLVHDDVFDDAAYQANTLSSPIPPSTSNNAPLPASYPSVPRTQPYIQVTQPTRLLSHPSIHPINYNQQCPPSGSPSARRQSSKTFARSSALCTSFPSHQARSLQLRHPLRQPAPESQPTTQPPSSAPSPIVHINGS